jgi:hypothetical protein
MECQNAATRLNISLDELILSMIVLNIYTGTDYTGAFFNKGKPTWAKEYLANRTTSFMKSLVTRATTNDEWTVDEVALLQLTGTLFWRKQGLDSPNVHWSWLGTPTTDSEESQKLVTWFGDARKRTLKRSEGWAQLMTYEITLKKILRTTYVLIVWMNACNADFQRPDPHEFGWVDSARLERQQVTPVPVVGGGSLQIDITENSPTVRDAEIILEGDGCNCGDTKGNNRQICTNCKCVQRGIK